MPKLGLSRQQLATFLKTPESIRAFEQLFDFQGVTPSTIEEAAALAGTAAAIAQQALGMLATYAEVLEQLSAAPPRMDTQAPDDFTPAAVPLVLGSMADQNADAVAITGGAIDGTLVGATTAAAGKFTDLTAAGKFGCNGKAAQSAVALGAAATDLATTITLVNTIRTTLIADGIGS